MRSPYYVLIATVSDSWGAREDLLQIGRRGPIVTMYPSQRGCRGQGAAQRWGRGRLIWVGRTSAGSDNISILLFFIFIFLSER